MSKKIKLLALSVFLLAILFASVLFWPSLSVKALLSNVLPDSLNNALLVEFLEEEPGDGIVEGFTAYYQGQVEDISVLFWKIETEKLAQEGAELFLNELKLDYDSMFDSVDWSSEDQFLVKGYQARAAFFKAYLGDEYYDGGVIFTAIKDYFLVIQIINYETAPALNDLTNSLNALIDNIPGKSPLPSVPLVEQEGGGIECGNNNCEYWAGENCKNCLNDCYYSFQSQGFCCYTGGYTYIYAHNYHNGVYDIRESLAGLIPGGAIIVAPGLNEDNMPLRPPSVCNNGVIQTGGCVYNYDCPSWLCTTENWCIELRSEEPQEIKDQQIVEEIYQDTNAYKTEYVDSYHELEDSTVQMRVREAKLNVSLEVQGATTGKVPEVSEGDEIEVRLEIENGSSYNLALRGGIFYPGYDAGMFDIEEKKYTISFEWEGGLASLIGSFKTKLVNSKYVIMPPGSKLYVFSKVIPKQTGYLDVQGLIFYNTEKKYQDWTPRFIEEAPDNYQETETSQTILVKEKPCNWWPICL
jgi:hypothetical protein